MKPDRKEKSFLQAVGGKVVAAFLIGGLAVVLAWEVLRGGFGEILMTVDRLSAPNEKLRTVNALFHNITRLNQLQQAYAIRKPDKPTGNLLQESARVLQTIDTLCLLSAGNPLQVQRLDSMRLILHTRNQLFDSYAKLKAEFMHNEGLSRRVRSVDEVIARRKPVVNNRIVQTRKKITTITLPQEPPVKEKKRDRPSFFGRLFGNRKTPEPAPALQQVKEEIKIRIDTVPVKKDNAIQKVQLLVRSIAGEQQQQASLLLTRELELVNAEAQLHQQLLRILQAIEAEEINLVKNNNQQATRVVNGSIDRIKGIMITASVVVVLLLLLIFADISRSNKYRRQLIAAKEEAEYLGQVKQRFLANMSHELRNPLQSIIGFAEQVRRQEKPDPAALEAIYRSSDHLLQIVNEVLDYSRIVSDRFSFEQRPFCLPQLAREVVETMRPQASSKQLALVLEQQALPDVLLLGDPFRLRQILYNLLGNAIKFTDSGQVSLQLSAVEADGQLQCCLVVSDTGIGIPASETARIFKVFEQVDGAVRGSSAGTGLGLSIVKALVESQGGSIAVTSAPGQGASFTIRLTFPKAPASPVSLMPARPLSGDSMLYPGTVLVVDDDAFILQLCSMIFNKHHIRHTATADGWAVLETDWDESLQLVLLDIRMPRINGLELCRALRPRLPAGCRVVALTAQAMPEEREAIRAQGFDGLLMKPFREQELLALIAPLASGLPEQGPEPDFAVLEQMTGGQQPLLQAVLQQFLVETRQDLEQLQQDLRQAGQEQAAGQAAAIVHRLAGRCGQIGARKLSARLQMAEEMLQHARPLPDSWLGEIAVLQQEVKAVLTVVAGKLQALQEAAC